MLVLRWLEKVGSDEEHVTKPDILFAGMRIDYFEVQTVVAQVDWLDLVAVVQEVA